MEECPRHGGARAKLIVTGLRSLLRLLHADGHVATALADAVPAAARRRAVRVPAALKPGDIQLLLDGCDRSAAPVSVTWYSIKELATSLARTAGRLRFEWILPGHGDRHRLAADEMSRRLRALAERTSLLRHRPIDFTAVRW